MDKSPLLSNLSSFCPNIPSYLPRGKPDIPEDLSATRGILAVKASEF